MFGNSGADLGEGPGGPPSPPPILGKKKQNKNKKTQKEEKPAGQGKKPQNPCPEYILRFL